MKTPLSRIALIAIMTVACSPFVHADNPTFPEMGRTYHVSFAENSRQDNGQIKVIRKGEGSWIFVEYTTRNRFRVAPRGAPDTPRTTSHPDEPKTITRMLWINTQWIVSASELQAEAEKK